MVKKLIMIDSKVLSFAGVALIIRNVVTYGHKDGLFTLAGVILIGLGLCLAIEQR